MGLADLWRYYPRAPRQNHRKASTSFAIQENEKHCIEMMGGLSDSTHRVHTAHTVVFNPDKWQHKFRKEWVATAEVTFGEIPLNVL